MTPDIITLFKSMGTADIFELVLIIGVAVVLVFSVQRVLPWLAARVSLRYRHNLLATVPLLRLLVVIIALLLVIPIVLDTSVRNMIALLGAAGLAIGFALKDYVSSLIAGVVSAFEQPYRIGDWIEIDGVYGLVTHIGMRTVEIVTADDNLVHIPHQKIWAAVVQNANNGSVTLQCVAHFYVDPEHDAKSACQALEDVAYTSAYLSRSQGVTVIAADKPWGSHYRIRAYPVEPGQQFRFVSDLTVRGRRALERVGAKPCRALPVADKPTS